jgi:type IV secretory pathway TraG/TraD family ATPase VirD4
MSDPWQMIGMAHRAAMQGMRLGKMAAVSGAQTASAARSRSAVRGGVLGPGDPPPPPGAPDFYDYRGIATAREVAFLDQRSLGPGSFRLGALLDVRRGGQFPLGLPLDVLRRHAVVVGPAGSGKTAGVLVPWIQAALRTGSSVVAVDVKGDLFEAVLAYARLDPFGPLGVPAAKWDFTDPARSISWDWIGETRDDAEIDAAVTAILGREDRSVGDPYFHRRDAMMLRGLLRLLPTVTRKGQGVTARSLLALLANQQRMEHVTTTYASAPGATDLTATLNGLSATDYPRAISGVTTALGRLDTAGVDAVTQPSQFQLTDLFSRPTLLVVTAPMKGGDTARFLSSLFLNLLAQRLYRRFGQQNNHMFLFVDEAARIVDRFNFEEVLSISRSAGVSVCLATQDVGQFKDESERSTIFANCATCVWLAGTSPLSAKLLSDRLGSQRVSSLTLNKDPTKWMSGTGHSIVTAPVLGDREIMQPPFGARCAIAHVNATELGIPTKPMLVDLSL